jgi:hypothetical protein
MSTFSGKRLSTFSGKCQPFQEIKLTPTPPKKEERLNLYQGLEAIHSTYFREVQGLYAHTERCQTCQSVKVKVDFGFSIFRKVYNNIYIIIYFELFFYFKIDFDHFDFDQLFSHFSFKPLIFKHLQNPISF